MTARKRPSAADYVASLDRPARKAKPREEAEATDERKRKITLYFREALLEEARSLIAVDKGGWVFSTTPG